MVQDIGAAVATGLAAFLAALPAIVGALVLLVVGWIVAGWLGSLVAKALRAIRMDDLMRRAGVDRFLQQAQVGRDAPGLVGLVVKWYLRLVVVVAAANVLGLEAFGTVLSDIVAFIPNLVVAVLILVVASWLAGIARNVVRGSLSASGMPNSGAIGTIAYVAVLGFGVVAALNQLGVAVTLVNTLFIGLVGALALAFGLAFGLGGRETAAEILRDWRANAERAVARAERTSAEPVGAGTASRREMRPSGNGEPETERTRRL